MLLYVVMDTHVINQLLSDLSQGKGYIKRAKPAQGCTLPYKNNTNNYICIVQNKTSSYLSTYYKQNKQPRLQHTTETKYKTHIPK